jgi:large subunit ribosomal protein L15
MQEKNYQGLHNLVAPIGARKKIKRVGRGESSGHGKTSGRGHKGQKARKSGNVRIGFEGGQIPFFERVPKVGFSNYLSRKTYLTVNVENLANHFQAGDVVDHAALVAAGLLSKTKGLVKVLGTGELTSAYTLKVNAISASARQKVEQAGGKIEIIG